ncbi:hypothetical protein V5799_030996 [Amblyomma americanum]|uniref:Uncharacterized protein n=1 Tax=Amblyomma americanum TaxID=6943 RepID=A0AAQ4EM55_AMBAM
MRIVKAEFEAMFLEGIARRFDGPCASPLHLVPKKTEGWLPCGDYRALNGRTIPDRYPVHHKQDFAQRIYGCHVFSVLDLKAYTQIPVNPDYLSFPFTPQLLCAGIVGILAVYSNSNYKSQQNRKPIFVLKDYVPGTLVEYDEGGQVVSFALSSLSGVLCLVAAAFLALHVLLYIDRYAQCRDDPMRRHCFCALAEGAARLYRYDRVTCLQVLHG